MFGLRTVAAAVSGRPGPVSSVRKALADAHGQDVFRVAKDLAGPAGMLAEAGPLGADAGWWAQGFLFSPALTVGGGTAEVLRNVIGERILGLPPMNELDAMATPMRPKPPCAKVGKPPVSGFQVVPPSVDLKRPLLGPEKTPFSQGPCLACQSTAYTVRGSRGSNARSTAPVCSSL